MDVSERQTKNILLPPKPEVPLESECCGTGCTPCVFDIHKKQLHKWEKQCEDILRQGYTSTSDKLPETDILSPEKYLSFKITKIIQECSSTKIFTFSLEHSTNNELTGKQDFPVKLGQHVLLRLKNISKQYTVLRINRDEKEFDILIKVYENGGLTSLIGKLLVNDSVDMRGPFGNELLLKINNVGRIVFIAAGTGISPMFRIIETILNDEESDTRLKLLFSCVNFKDIPLTRELKEWSLHWNFSVTYYLSSNRVRDEKENETTGSCQLPYYGMNYLQKRIDRDELKQQLTNCDLSTQLFLVCGTKSFDKDMINYLTQLNVDSSKILTF